MTAEQSDLDDVPLTPAQQHELNVRLDAYRRDPEARLSWEDAQIFIRMRHRSGIVPPGEGTG
jgi:putative addiction module component (TIGR02574 family)